MSKVEIFGLAITVVIVGILSFGGYRTRSAGLAGWSCPPNAMPSPSVCFRTIPKPN